MLTSTVVQLVLNRKYHLVHVLMFVISVVGFVHWIQTELKGQGQIAFHIDIYLERLFHHVNSTFDL